MSSNLKVNTILPSTGTTIGIGTVGGLINVVGNIDVNSTSGISTFNGLEISGIVTAKAGAAVTYYGDGSNLTGITDNVVTINNNANNRVITGSGSANTLEGEANLQWDGETLYINRSSNSIEGLSISNSNNSQGSAAAQLNLSGGDNSYSNIRLECNSTSHHIRQDGSGNLKFLNNTTERLRITSAGYVGINQTSPVRPLHITGNDGSSGATSGNSDTTIIVDNAGTNGSMIEFLNANNGAGHLMFTDTDATNRGRISYHHNGDYFRFDTSGSESMRSTKNANGTKALYINLTSEVSGANSHLVVNNSVAIVSGSTFRSFYMSGNGNAYFWNGSNQPYISSGGSFTNASDVSLKKDITDLTYGIDVLKNLKPRKYKMKADDKEQIGFIAQEVETAVPEVVDASETPNGDQHKGLAYGNLTAVLTKALQEAVTKIETLEAKVAALEGS